MGTVIRAACTAIICASALVLTTNAYYVKPTLSPLFFGFMLLATFAGVVAVWVGSGGNNEPS